MTRTVERKPITAAMQLAVWKRDGFGYCSVCKEQMVSTMLQIDHHLALVDGGAHEIANLRFVCVHCHKTKSAHEHKENARAKRRARKHSQLTPPSRMTHPKLKRKMDGRVVPRATGER